MSKFNKTGFNGLDKLYEESKSPALLFGSVVDCLVLTPNEFNDRFLVLDFPKFSDSISKIIDSIVNDAKENGIKKIDDDFILKELDANSYQTNWKNETRLNKFKEIAYDIIELKVKEEREIINTELYYQATECKNKLECLKDEDSGVFYFSEDPFSDSVLDVEVYSQLKFKAQLKKREYKCMIDRLIIDNTNKTIKIVDLKTTGYKEWDFYKGFVDWFYDIQARLYYQIVNQVINGTEYENYKILPVEFICINKESLMPLVWKCDFCMAIGDLTFGKDNQIEFKYPESIADELEYYLNEKPNVPIGIKNVNNLRTYLKEL